MDESEAGTGGAIVPAEEAAAALKPKRKLLVIGAAALLLMGGAGGAGWWFLTAPSAHAETAPEVDAESLVDMPEMTVNLRTADGGSKFLRVHLMLVPGDAGKETIEARLPLVRDSFQPFLRELRPEDIVGSAAVFRVKEEMLVRSNRVLGAGAVRDVLIQDLVQQ